MSIDEDKDATPSPKGKDNLSTITAFIGGITIGSAVAFLIRNSFVFALFTGGAWIVEKATANDYLTGKFQELKVVRMNDDTFIALLTKKDADERFVSKVDMKEFSKNFEEYSAKQDDTYATIQKLDGADIRTGIILEQLQKDNEELKQEQKRSYELIIRSLGRIERNVDAN